MKLRALEISDLPLLYQWENDATAWADSATHNPLSQHLLRQYIQEQTGDIYKDGQLRLMLDDNGATLGCIDLFDLDPISRRAAIGMYIAPDARGKGAGQEALRLLEEYAFRFLGLHTLYAIIGADNTACLSIYRKADYTIAGTLPQWIRRNKIYIDALLFLRVSPEQSSDKSIN